MKETVSELTENTTESILEKAVNKTTIGDVKESKKLLEEVLLKMLGNFEKEYGVKILCVTSDREYPKDKKSFMKSVKVSLEI